MIVAPSGAATALPVASALDRACSYLLALQQPDGWWKAELETNICMDAEDLFLRQFLGIRGATETAQSATWIRSQQRPDGGWGIAHGSPIDLSATVEAYAALRLAGDPVDADHMRRAREVVLDLGGLERSRVFTRIWLALFDLWSWDDLPVLPPEIVLLPPWFPLNLYDFACWARQTIVPLSIVTAHRPQRRMPFTLPELRRGDLRPERAPLSSWAGAFQRLDSFLHVYERRPLRRLRQHSLRLAAEWIIRRQESDGCWGGIQPPWVYSIIALHLLGYPLDHPLMKKGIEGLDTFAIVDEKGRRLEACQSPVWDTCLASLALLDAGLPGDHPALVRAADWMMHQEIRVRGDWAVRRPKLEPSGWAFEFENDNYPDIDDTAEVILALRQIDHPDRKRRDAVIARAVAWTRGMQCKDGGFAAFDVDNNRALCREIPFCDFGEVIDPPSADVTAHVLEMLAAMGAGREAAAIRARDWLLRTQEADGSWFGRWGVNHIYGTGAVVPALVRAGAPADSAPIRAAVRWLEQHQNPDGGWGEELRSYEEVAWRGRGGSTASQTAWALLALLDGDGDERVIERGIEFLVRSQRPDGGWDEDAFTGTGFPSDFYIKYHLYRINFPIQALGRYVARGRGRG